MCDWSGLYEISCVAASVGILSATVRDAMEQAIPRGCNRKNKFPPWLSNTVRYYFVKNNYFRCRFKKKQWNYFHDKFALYRNVVKYTIRCDRSRWLKSIDNNLKSQFQHFWKYLVSEIIYPVIFRLTLIVHTYSSPVH
jgi:hypothetical protein